MFEPFDSASPAQVEHLVFFAGQRWYAVDAQAAQEIVSFPELLAVPGAAPHLLGIFAHRGEIIPVVDLGRLRGEAPENSRRAVLLRTPQGACALLAKSVEGVSEIKQGPKPEGPELPYFQVSFVEGERSVSVVQLDALFEHLSRASG